MERSLKKSISSFVSHNPDSSICAIDLETLVVDSGGFLTGERIIAISISVLKEEIESYVFVADADSAAEEMRILRELDQKLAEISPTVILGYNHTGYDIPLVITKIRNLGHEDRNRNLEYFLGSAWCMDMKYLIAEDLYSYDGFYRIRKLEDVIAHEKYSSLETMGAKGFNS